MEVNPLPCHRLQKPIQPCPVHWILQSWIQFKERHQYKGAFPDTRMRDAELREVKPRRAVKKYVDVDRPRPLGDFPGPIAAQLFFYPLGPA